jgi:hypothetical protein
MKLREAAKNQIKATGGIINETEGVLMEFRQLCFDSRDKDRAFHSSSCHTCLDNAYVLRRVAAAIANQ